MNDKYRFTFSGKIVEILNREGECFIRIKLEPAFLELPCGINKDYRLEDEISINVDLIILSIQQKNENIIKQNN